MSRLPLGPLGGDSLGDYLREQRQSAKLSLRQLSELAGVSNPYLSQIERGLKKPSAEILQQLAKGLEVSAESLYVRAGILDERHGHEAEPLDTRAVIGADPKLTDRQRDCVFWAARGKSDWEIAQILGIGHETVIQHLKQARERYGVTKRTMLAVSTLFDGTISFIDILKR